jgi:hypothetical protein
MTWIFHEEVIINLHQIKSIRIQGCKISLFYLTDDNECFIFESEEIANSCFESFKRKLVDD